MPKQWRPGGGAWTSGSRDAPRSSAAPPPGWGARSQRRSPPEGANVAMFARRRDQLEREAERIGALAVRGDLTNPEDLIAARRPDGRGLRRRSTSSSTTAAGRRAPPASGSPTSLREPRSSCCCSRRSADASACRHLRRRGHAADREHQVELGARAGRQPRALQLGAPGVMGWAKSMARELGPTTMTVNTIAPGRIDTARLAEVYVNRWRAETCRDPAPTLRRAARVADVVCFLASDRACYVTGAVDPGRRRPHAVLL